MKRFTLKSIAAGLMMLAASNGFSQVVLQNHSKTPSLLFTNRDLPGVQMYRIIGSDDTLSQSPTFRFGGSADGMGMLRNGNGTFTLVTNHEDNFAISRVTFDQSFKPVKGEYILNSNGGIWRLCSGTLAVPEVHGFGPMFLSGGESGPESMIHGVNPYMTPITDTTTVENTSYTLLRGLGRWSTENAVPLPKMTYPGKTVIIIGDDDFQGAGQIVMYMSDATGDLENGKVFVARRKDLEPRETKMLANVSYDIEFIEVPNIRTLTAPQITAFCDANNAIRLGRGEDVDYRKGSWDAAREVYLVTTGQDYTGVNADTSRTKYGRIYRMNLDPQNPLQAKLTCVLDGDNKAVANVARVLYNPDNITVTNDYVYISEDPNGYAPSGNPSRHDARIYQYDIETENMIIVAEMDHRRGGSAYPDSAKFNQNSGATAYSRSSTGSWEFGAMIDVSKELNIDNTFLVALQPHSWRSSVYRGVDGGTLRKAENQGSALVILKNIPRAKVKLPIVADVTGCKDDSVVLTATGGYNMAEYFWYDAPSGGTLLATGPNFMTVANQNKTYFVSAKALGTEGPRQSVNVTVVQKPVASLPATVIACESTTIDAGNAGSTYLWSDNSTTQTLEVDRSGVYTVAVTNANGCTVMDTINVTINALPPTPIITVNGTLLTSSNPTGNQWYKDGIIIPNATAQTYTATESGAYTVRTTNVTTGCVSMRSSSVAVVILGLDDEFAANDFKVYPNPNDGQFNLKFRLDEMSNVRIQVINVLGQVVYTEDVKNFQGEYMETINLSNFANGQYIVNVFTDNLNMQKAIQKQ
jgi:hypothetical protein